MFWCFVLVLVGLVGEMELFGRSLRIQHPPKLFFGEQIDTKPFSGGGLLLDLKGPFSQEFAQPHEWWSGEGIGWAVG